MYVWKSIGALKVGECFKFDLDDRFEFKLLDVEEITEDIIVVNCKATKNRYKYDRYETFKGKVLKSLAVFVKSNRPL